MHATKMQTYRQIEIHVSKVKSIYLDLSEYMHSFLIMEGIPLPNSSLSTWSTIKAYSHPLCVSLNFFPFLSKPLISEISF